MRDRDRPGQRRHRRRGVRIAVGGARDHVTDLLAAEPARLDKLLGVDRDLFAQRLGEKAHHQGRREWPRLRGEVADAPTADARLLADLAPHRVLERLTRLHVAGETGEPGARAAASAAEERALAPDRQHDDDRVDAREMMRLAAWAMARPATGRHFARCPALRAEAVPRVP